MKKLLTVALAFAACGAFAEVPYKIGIAGFSFHQKSLDQALETMKAIDCHYLCHKDFMLGYDADDVAIEAYRQKLAKFGVESLSTGPLYAKDAATARKQFEFAKRYGMKVVVGVPYGVKDGAKDAWGADRIESDAMMDEIEKLVKEFDIRYAIHNHGPDLPSLFPTAESALARIGNRDPRIGVCLDVGHEQRAGFDPVAFIRKHADRIFDVHLKNIKVDAKQNLAMQGPRGELPIVGILTALAEVGYDGVCHIEYERDFQDNALGLAESLGYYRGVADSVKVPARMMPAPENANTLTAAEKADGWELLWDGETLNGWVGVKNGCARPPQTGWVIKDRTLTMRPVKGISPEGAWFPLPPEDQKLGGGGDIVTIKRYRDFELTFDFRLTRAANSGVKYFFNEKENRGTCEEYQILEDSHPDSTKGTDGNRRLASLYDIYAAKIDGLTRPVGQWNTGKIISKGAHVEHWLNGKCVLTYTRHSPEFKAAVRRSKYATWGDGQDWGELEEGRILLQDHSDSTVSFCNLKIKEL